MTTRMWKVSGENLQSVPSKQLEKEKTLEGWIEADPSILGLELLIIGRQVQTPHGVIDLLAITSDGEVKIIELKRDKTPRDIVAQTLDYASWVCRLSFSEVEQRATSYLQSRGIHQSFADVFFDRFGEELPEEWNGRHGMLIIASELDAGSKRIVEYLSAEHELNINTLFFTCFQDGSNQFLTADWLMEQSAVVARAKAKTSLPDSGIFYVNGGDGEFRSWVDEKQYAFIAAGGGSRYSNPLKKLTVGSPIYVYQKKHGYVASGRVIEAAVRARDFLVNGKSILECDLANPNLGHDSDNDEDCEYLVRVRWLRAVDLTEAVGSSTGPPLFANQNIVCKLRDPRTLEILGARLGDPRDDF